MSFGGGGPSPAEQQRQAEAARKAEEARLAQEQAKKDAETLKNTLAEKTQQAASEAKLATQRQAFQAGPQTKTTLGAGQEEDLTKKKTLLANYGTK